MYWVDAKHHVIERADLDGQNRKAVISQGEIRKLKLLAGSKRGIIRTAYLLFPPPMSCMLYCTRKRSQQRVRIV